VQLFPLSNQEVRHLIGEVFSLYHPVIIGAESHKQSLDTHYDLSFQLLEFTEI
jgi:hypothetical protein